MDIRFNIIKLVHRSTARWAFRASVRDPRTGEIIKGNVSLGSLRIRQDVMLGTGMIPLTSAMGVMGLIGARGDEELQCEAGNSPEADYLASASANDPATDSVAMALARI